MSQKLQLSDRKTQDIGMFISMGSPLICMKTHRLTILSQQEQGNFAWSLYFARDMICMEHCTSDMLNLCMV